jgi:decaprenylphospho-beta-D-ribofuranose 2-oxidase
MDGPSPTTGKSALYSGWGRRSPSAAQSLRPHDVWQLDAVLGHDRFAVPSGPARSGVIARGSGRSYGDAAQCGGGTVLDMACFNDIGAIDPASGLVDVGAGVTLHQLLEHVTPKGWFVPVSPGTRQVTIGGAIAADIHGKNHHVDGAFCRHVARCTLVTPSGTFMVGPEDEAELFWATAGGMGLTGVITSATIRLIPVETSWMTVETRRFADLESVMAEMESTDTLFRYSVAWVDTLIGGPRMGRSVLTRGEHAPLGALSSHQARSWRQAPGKARIRVPVQAPSHLLNRATIAAFNEFWFRKTPRQREGQILAATSFFHPLDGVADWNLLYGRRGFLQYQFCVGPTRVDVVPAALRLLRASRVPTFLGVLKRFGPGNPGPLSFPMEGWTLALDLPMGAADLRGALERLDDLVAEAGGRVYLAKDSRLSPQHFSAMYPRSPEFAAVKDRVDPTGILQSDQSRRLGLTGTVAA